MKITYKPNPLETIVDIIEKLKLRDGDKIKVKKI
jgi:hypothetical protein